MFTVKLLANSVIASDKPFFSIVIHFIIAYHIYLVNVLTKYCNNNLLILHVKQLNKIMKLYYFYTLKALWDGLGKIKMYYEMSSVKKQLSRKKVYCYIVLNMFEHVFTFRIPLEVL